MKIALTGGSGRIGLAITEQALARGDSIVSIDRVGPPQRHESVRYVRAEMSDYDALLEAFAGCDAMIHMAAIPSPFRQPDHVVHNNNVVGSYNAMRAAIECGIRRICQASSVNAIGLSYSREPHFDYLPLDEVLEVLAAKPEMTHVIVTGRNAPEALIAAADLVTEMAQVKHPFRDQGVKAQAGIEF